MKLLSVVLLLTLALSAQSNSRSRPASSKTSVTSQPGTVLAGPAQQVSMAQLRLRDAVLAGDTEQISKLLSDDHIAVLPSGTALGKKKLIDAVMNGREKPASIAMSEMQVRMLAPGAGVVTARVEPRSMNGAVAGTYRVMVVWHRQQQDWKAVALQVTAVAARL